MSEELGIDRPALGASVMRLFPRLLGVWLFGSFATGHANRESDVDLAVLVASPLDLQWDEMEHLATLSGLVRGRRVDLVDLRRAPLALRFEVARDGIRLAARDLPACDLFEMAGIGMYQDSLIERKEILADITARGTVY